MKSISKILILFFIILTAISIGVNYYLSQPKEFPSEMCWKNKYLVRLGDEGSVYTRMKNFACDVDGDIIILEETK